MATQFVSNGSGLISVKDYTEDRIIELALNLCQMKFKRGEVLSSPAMVIDHLRLLCNKDHEVFSVIFLDNRHRIIKYEEMFRGTIDGASVYPREVVKEALNCGAAAVIYVHNHPSGVVTPSEADKRITQKLKDALALVDVRSLDHCIVSATDSYSFAEHGLI